MPNRLLNAPLILLIALVIAMIGGGVGYHLGFKEATKNGDLAMSTYKTGLATVTAAGLNTALQNFGQRVALGNLLTSQLVDQERGNAQTAADLHAQVPHVTTVYRPAPAAQPVPVPACVFTRGWLRSYNAAIGASVPANAQGTSVPAQATETTGAAPGDDDLAPAAITQAGVLSHHIDYAAGAKDLEAQLNKLIDYEEGLDVKQ
ncbi:hypothetical protein K6V72_24280 [Ralstonia insidiosa]|uniref:hypothetical protein n=1 Tax=Ralstonia insidiosa TaxID=190721 RepID=UPI001244D44E|nr:hypothetical protein [Ralstonia insidiosa]KAB0473915.1 hypothetical protein F7R11_15710 [Ralstonia insidiosa]MBY4912136.1 hypothetical protein [Ralstonia insidiosa]